MSHYARRTDANQKSITAALRRAGFSVEPKLSRIGSGAPDLLVGGQVPCMNCGHREARALLLEIKNLEAIPSKRVLTPDELEWHKEWRGHVAIVETVEQALMACGVDVRK